MGFELFECIDAGTEYCPCHLAETGECIQCSELGHDKCCDCSNWKGICIYQEYAWNGFKCKDDRKYYNCTIIDKIKVYENLFIIDIKAPYNLIQSLTPPGSFVFLRKEQDENCFDAPISIMSIDTKEETFKVAIEAKGIKTKKIDELSEGDNILVKGPYWNGILGLRHLKNCKNSTAILIGKGIGQAPMVAAMKYLNKNNNKIISIIDNGSFNNNFIQEYLDEFQVENFTCCTFDNGKIPMKYKELLIDIILKEKPSLVHCNAFDILNYETMKVVENINKGLENHLNIQFSCCNNAKMCCGNGVCGCCTIRNDDNKLRRMCKMQTDPKYVFEGRRLF